MAHKGKRFELRPVDEIDASPTPVVRLDNQETTDRNRPIRLLVPASQVKVSTRLDVPVYETQENRTYEPTVEVLIETPIVPPENLEEAWGQQIGERRHVPWGWFAIVAILFVASTTWSLLKIHESQPEALDILASTQFALDTNSSEDIAAGLLIEKINSTTRKFFLADNIEDLAKYSRDPDRVIPLMREYYSETPLAPNPIKRSKSLVPLPFDKLANFWLETVELQNHTTQNIIIELNEAGEVKVDWETLVCYQPMKWDKFALTRPTGESLDFRVYAEVDNFYSHEFENASRWNCFRLTAFESEETLFGYSLTNDAVSDELMSYIQKNEGRRVSVIVRVSIPPALRSRRGVIIEKIMCPRWVYLNAPEN